MRKLSTELQEVIQGNAFLARGMREGLFNSSALARLLQPILEARLKKEVTLTSIAMALSRAIEPSKKESSTSQDYSTSDIGIRSNLELISFTQSNEVRRELEKFYRKLQRKDLFATLTEGIREVTLIFERSDYDVEFLDLGKPLVHRKEVGCIAIYFPKNYGSTPGFLYAVFQQLFFQNINVVEIASTSRELLVYLDEKDLQLGFDTLYRRFVEKRR